MRNGCALIKASHVPLPIHALACLAACGYCSNDDALPRRAAYVHVCCIVEQ
ncbi:hypothetical protein BRPE64_DCDS04130 (plasmid) [Caballeronia insecticola]|uniref:Uncharacterized protein n=1 Tax=Caballeronia insecticola TaxID=758793 RepID=R4WS01_9BURK|nr:hypothetical protein BRPE64_DCDS04130 [Caballeronia insecticola]